MTRTIALSTILAAFAAVCVCSEARLTQGRDSIELADGQQAERIPVDFEKSIAPLLQARCLGCHGRKTQEGGLRLDSREALLKGGAGGSVIEIGEAGGSRLIRAIAATSEDQLMMPPEGPRFTPEQTALFRQWIDEGAVWPAHVVLNRSPKEAAASHWAFRPVSRPLLPKAQRSQWPKNGIDEFILARLESLGIAPSPEAERGTYARRVTLDLTGLPPGPDEVDAYVADDSPDAKERLLDRLFASPRYGERWARPWLDLCHYGDTDGYLTDQIRPVAWRYRQWLIEALNADLPLDEFTRQQLAGDLLPHATQEQVMATGFLRNTLSNREGGADLEEYRVEQIVDRTSMVGTAWLGLTVGCARCHDHKYDPISQLDFYSLYAFFDNVDEINIDAPLMGEFEPYHAKKPEYDRKRSELIAPQAAAIAELQDQWEKRMLHAVANPGQDFHWDRQWEVLGLIWGGELGEGQLEGCQIVLLPLEHRTQDQRDRLLDYFLKHGEITDPAKFKELKIPELRANLEALAKELPRVTRAPAMRESQTPRHAYVHIRGDFRVRGDHVTPRVPDWLGSAQSNEEYYSSNTAEKRSTAGAPESDAPRMRLVDWLLSSEQPLTHRVFVNRAWQELFGRGLVGSPDNFGTQGTRPSHPELLDWLADEFRTRRGSFKSLHRLIVLSATYAQSSRVRNDVAALDPNNQLLARQSSIRLSAEQVRDSALMVSGLLAERVGGPSVFPPQPEAVAMEGFDNAWKASSGSDRYRRGLYTWLQRLSPFAQGITFDAPANARVCSRRERSNTPLQALTLLNDPTFWESAQALSARLMRESSPEFEKRLKVAFQLCLGRSPDPTEHDRLRAYYDDRREVLTGQREAAIAVAGAWANHSDAVEAAAWTEIASILLNLHEFITRD